MLTPTVIAGGIFILAYFLIIFEIWDRTAIAIFGAVLMVITGVLTQAEAFNSVDYNTIGLLISMMIIVMITKETGIFEYLALKQVRLAKGDPVKILIYLSFIAAILSAFLDNVTTILLILPITFTIITKLKLKLFPYVITQVFASNIGGTTTLIGDPPNIMIGGATGLSFLDFILNLAPVVIIIFLITIYLLVLIYRKYLIVETTLVNEVLNNTTNPIKNKPLLIKCLLVLSATIVGFILHSALRFESVTIAMSGAALLLLISKIKLQKIFNQIEWKTIFFFFGLFVIVGGVEKVGILDAIAKYTVSLTQGNIPLTGLIILWVSAIASAFVDNIPFVATMIPLIKSIGTISGVNTIPLFWCLSLGACLGGNGTLVGASANVIAVGLLEEKGEHVSFLKYFKTAFPLMIVSILISSVYLVLFIIQ